MKRHFNDIKKYRALLYELVISDIKVRYRRSVLGIVWSVLQPLGMMLILTVVFSTLFASDIEYFAVYVLTGRIIWDLFSTATIMAQSSIISSSGLIKKVYVPKYIFPVSKVFSSLVNCLFSLVALLIVVYFSGANIGPSIVLLPVPLILLFIFALGVSLFISAYTVFFRDLSYLYELLLTAWMYLTPIFYPIDILPPNMLTLVKFNPIIYYLDVFRSIVYYGTWPDSKSLIFCVVASFVSLVIGFWTFTRKEDKFILHI